MYYFIEMQLQRNFEVVVKFEGGLLHNIIAQQHYVVQTMKG